MLDNRVVLREIFGSTRDEVTGEWRRWTNEELNDLYCSPDIIRVIKKKTEDDTGCASGMYR